MIEKTKSHLAPPGSIGPQQRDGKIEITPKMVEAGAATLLCSGRVSHCLPDWAAQRVVQDILEASLSLARRR